MFRAILIMLFSMVAILLFPIPLIMSIYDHFKYGFKFIESVKLNWDLWFNKTLNSLID